MGRTWTPIKECPIYLRIRRQRSGEARQKTEGRNCFDNESRRCSCLNLAAVSLLSVRSSRSEVTCTEEESPPRLRKRQLRTSVAIGDEPGRSKRKKQHTPRGTGSDEGDL